MARGRLQTLASGADGGALARKTLQAGPRPHLDQADDIPRFLTVRCGPRRRRRLLRPSTAAATVLTVRGVGASSRLGRRAAAPSGRALRHDFPPATGAQRPPENVAAVLPCTSLPPPHVGSQGHAPATSALASPVEGWAREEATRGVSLTVAWRRPRWASRRSVVGVGMRGRPRRHATHLCSPKMPTGNRTKDGSGRGKRGRELEGASRRPRRQRGAAAGTAGSPRPRQPQGGDRALPAVSGAGSPRRGGRPVAAAGRMPPPAAPPSPPPPHPPRSRATAEQ